MLPNQPYITVKTTKHVILNGSVSLSERSEESACLFRKRKIKTSKADALSYKDSRKV
jgi:surface antigen